MKPVFIYALLDPRTMVTRYCGQTIDPDRRLKEHVRLLKALGLNPLMEILDVVPDSEADFWEREYIQNFRERGFDLINFSDGGNTSGMLGKKHTPEAIAKMRACRLGEKNPFFGKHHTPEHCASISANQSGSLNPNFGIKFPPEFCANQSRLKTGLKQSAKHIEKRVSKFRGKKQSPEVIENRTKKLRGQKRTPEQCENMRRGQSYRKKKK